jgi:hypothetical protein
MLLIINIVDHEILRLQESVVVRVYIFMLVALVLLMRKKLLVVRRRLVLHILCILPLSLLDTPMKLVIRLVQKIIVANILINHTLTSQVIPFHILVKHLVQV